MKIEEDYQQHHGLELKFACLATDARALDDRQNNYSRSAQSI